MGAPDVASMAAQRTTLWQNGIARTVTRVPLRDEYPAFEIGDAVNIVGGIHAGKPGVVVAVDPPTDTHPYLAVLAEKYAGNPDDVHVWCSHEEIHHHA